MHASHLNVIEVCAYAFSFQILPCCFIDVTASTIHIVVQCFGCGKHRDPCTQDQKKIGTIKEQSEVMRLRSKPRSPAVLALRFFLATSLCWIVRPARVPTEVCDIDAKSPSPFKFKKHETTNDNSQWDFLESLSQEDALVEWIQSLDGGSVNTEAFEIQRTDHSDGSLNPEFDLVATKDISRGTILMEIPQEAMIGGIATSLQETLNDEHNYPFCMAIESIANERQKGASSQYYPYLNFLFGSGNPMKQIPSDWSAKAQDIFWSMMGGEGSIYFPNDLANNIRHIDICEGYKEVSKLSHSPNQTATPDEAKAWQEHRASIEQEAFIYFLKNAWGTSLIPLFDMIPHRNGKWRNIEARYVESKANTPVALKPRDNRFNGFCRMDERIAETKLVVYAHRDIQKGESLRVSLTHCEHLGCENMKHKYTVDQLLANTGILEEYPRRWYFDLDPDHLDSNNSFIFEIDVGDADLSSRTVRILQKKELDQNYMSALLDVSVKRWRNVGDELVKLMENWDMKTAQDRHEYNMIRDYQRAYVEAFELAWLHRHDEADPLSAKNTTQKYDDLSKPKGSASHTKGDYRSCANEPNALDDCYTVGVNNNFYQEISFVHEPWTDNTFMFMKGANGGGETILHSGSPFRAHYHEAVIHVGLQYVKTPKRVAYIGGGDNMVLEELLKYDSIEKIVGMELDQQVSRSSMKYFGTTPSYHDDRVEWWYGDGALSLHFIPEDYFESFDLVLIDLLTEAAGTIMVTAGLNIAESAVLLMKPDIGVMAMNEDFANRPAMTKRLAKKGVMYDYYNVPIFCESSITIVSNSVDFLRGPRYDHGIKTKAQLTNFDEDNYTGWSRYFDTNTTKIKDSKLCNRKQTIAQEQRIMSGGVLLAIEVENVTKSLEAKSLPNIHKTIKRVAKNHGLSPLTTLYKPEEDIHAHVLLCENGYIKMQTYPQFQYVAFDLVLWGGNSFMDKSNAIQKDLVSLVGGGHNENSVSVFRVVTGGKVDSKQANESNNGIFEKAIQYYCGDGNTDIDEEAKDGDYKPNPENDETPELETVEEVLSDQFMYILLHRLLSGITFPNPNWDDQASLVVIFCGNKDANNCQTYSSFPSEYGEVVHPVYSCESFDDMAACESKITQNLLNIVSQRKKLLDGFVLDRSVPLNMGKIIHKIFNNTMHQSEIFEWSFSALAPGGKDSWRNILLDRFRTEIIIAPPIHKADFGISNGTHSEEWSAISFRNDHFFACLQSSLENIQRETGLVAITREIVDSVTPIVTDIQDSKKYFTDQHFFREAVMDQWFDQRPVANQYVLQMEVIGKNESVSIETLELVFEQSVVKAGLVMNGTEFNTFKAGNGYLVSYLSPKGSGIMKWDGRRADVNFLLKGNFEEDPHADIKVFSNSFLSNIPILKDVASDSFPRGYGKIVNFQHEMLRKDENGTVTEYIPLWMRKHVPSSIKVDSPELYYISEFW